MRILMIGDIVGRPGRLAVREILPALVEAESVDFVIANGENAAGGVGITPKTLEEILQAGVDVVTTGNHVYRRREIIGFVDQNDVALIRPANLNPGSPGRGAIIREDRSGRRVAVLNLQGRVFMSPAEDPFALADRMVGELRRDTAVILVDMHAEATSEKIALARFLDGRVSMVAGTHTHVPTADACILPGGTGYVTDLGMTGPHDSCLGVISELVIHRFRSGFPVRFEVATGDVRLQGAIVDVDVESGSARSVTRVERCLA